MYKSSLIRQKGESQEKAKHAKFSEKRIFLTPWYAHVRGIRPFALLLRELSEVPVSSYNFYFDKMIWVEYMSETSPVKRLLACSFNHFNPC